MGSEFFTAARAANGHIVSLNYQAAISAIGLAALWLTALNLRPVLAIAVVVGLAATLRGPVASRLTEYMLSARARNRLRQVVEGTPN